MVETRTRRSWPVVPSDFWRDVRRTEAHSDGADAPAWTPAATISESPDGYRVRLQLTGVPRDAIQIDLAADALVVSGERAALSLEGGDRVIVSEIPSGRFVRRFRIGPDIDRDGIEASLEDGMLELLVPKRAEAQPRRIDIISGGDA